MPPSSPAGRGGRYLALAGPTASGKTAVAMAIAQQHAVEIISVDSALVYRGMDIGTAKPTAQELAAVPHHLINIRDPLHAYSAAEFVQDAQRLIGEINARGKLPLLVGGTMLYFKALREGLADLPEADIALRAEIDAAAETKGWPALHAELAKLDPDTAARLKTTDAQRIQRALEVVRLTGKPMADLFSEQKTQPLPYQTIAFGLAPADRHWLHQRIAQRFDEMLQNGLVGEVEAMRSSYQLNGELPSMRCVGYRQTWEMIEGRLAKNELRDQGIFATRQFAKRQLTWLNGFVSGSFKDMEILDCQKPGLAATIATCVERQDTNKTP